MTCMQLYAHMVLCQISDLSLILVRYGDIMTVYLGVRQTIYLNTYDVIKEAFVKQGHSFSGRPQDLFHMRELCKNIGRLLN